MRILLLAILLAGIVTVAQAQVVRPGDLILPPAQTIAPGTARPAPPPVPLSDPDQVIAEVNGHQITRAQAAEYPGGVEEAIDQIVFRQAYERSVSVYDPEFLEYFRIGLRRHVSQLYFDYVLERFIKEEGLEKEFETWLEGYKNNLQADFTVYLILRHSEAEARALISWIRRGYSFEETMRDYSELSELLETSPIGARFREQVALLRTRLQEELKPGELTEKPIKMPFGYLIAYKSPFEEVFQERIRELRKQYFARFRESLRARLIDGMMNKFQATYESVPRFTDIRLPAAPEDEVHEMAWIPEDRLQFNITRADLIRRFMQIFFYSFGIPPQQVLEDAYVHLIQEMVTFNEARSIFNETSPAVQQHMEKMTSDLRKMLFLDKKIRELPEYDELVKKKYEDLRKNYDALSVYKIRELATPSFSDITSILQDWRGGTAYEKLTARAFSSVDMTSPMITKYITIGQRENGSRYYVHEEDQNRYGSELLKMKVGDITTTPVFHSGQWAVYQLAFMEKGAFPEPSRIEPVIVRALHDDVRAEIIENLRTGANIKYLNAPAP